jgi:hypothetical protein
MADTDNRAAAADAGSYRTKLMQPSKRDDLSTPDQQATTVKLPPVKDAGTPPMTVNTTTAEAPAGADDTLLSNTTAAPAAAAAAAAASHEMTTLGAETTEGTGDGTDPAVRSHHGNLWSPTGNTQSPTEGRHTFKKCVGGRMGSASEEYCLPEGGIPVSQPQHVDDYPGGQEEGEIKSAAVGATGDDSTSAATSGGSRKGGFSAPEPDKQAEPSNDSAAKAAAAADIPEPAVGVAKEGDVVSDDLPQDTSAASEAKNPLAAAAAAVSKPVAAVTKPVAAAVGQLKNIVLGSGEKSEGDVGQEAGEAEKSEGVLLAESEGVDIGDGEKVPSFAVL